MTGAALTKAIEEYGTDSLKALLTTIPIIGSVFSYYDTKHSLARIEGFIHSIKDELEQFKIEFNSESDKKYIASLWMKIFEGVQNDLLEEKYELFKNCLLGTLKNPPQNSPEFNIQQFFIDCLNKLNLQHVETLKRWSIMKKAAGSVFQSVGFLTLDEINEKRGERTLLESQVIIQAFLPLGLVQEKTNSFGAKEYGLTELGKEFLNFVKTKN
ncbi:MAG: hypothetical protein ACK481_03635 [Candidatus Melainabacteria bacterium]|jgi:hypothetical protein